MQIRLSKIEDLNRIVYILNTVTLHLIQKGISQWRYPWDEERIFNQIKNNFFYVQLENDEIIGVFCIYEIDSINEFPVNEKCNYLSQIAILPQFQGRNFGSEILNFACSFSKKMNKTFYLTVGLGMRS